MSEKEKFCLIAGAMECEVSTIKKNMQVKKVHRIGNWEYAEGTLQGGSLPILLAQTYQGTVNAAGAIAIAVSHFAIGRVINFGIGGGHIPSLHKGDIVLSEKVVPLSALNRHFSPLGAGIDERDFELYPLEVKDRESGKTYKVSEFPGDTNLLRIAADIPWKGQVQSGVIASGDEWNNQIDRIAMLHERFGTLVEDMESVSCAAICLSGHIPFLGIRILSNNITNGEEFDESYAEKGQEFVLNLLKALDKLRQK